MTDENNYSRDMPDVVMGYIKGISVEGEIGNPSTLTIRFEAAAFGQDVAVKFASPGAFLDFFKDLTENVVKVWPDLLTLVVNEHPESPGFSEIRRPVLMGKIEALQIWTDPLCRNCGKTFDEAGSVCGDGKVRVLHDFKVK